MKKILLALTTTVFIGNAMAQCTPDMTETVPGLHPTTIENIAPATVGVPYSQTITVIIPTDTTVEIIPGFPTTVPITKAVVTSLTGLPAGFTYACNPSTCEFPGGTTKCAIITGTATAGQEGAYPLNVFVTYYAGSLTADDTVTGYILNVNPATGLAEISKNNALSAHVAPNPFVSNANIEFTAVKSGDVKISVFNLLGKVVKTETVRATAGENQYTLRGNTLPSGVYLMEVFDGKNKITQRLIKQ